MNVSCWRPATIWHPLLERVKFLAISGSNLDEYFMVRLSGLREALEAGVTSLTPDGRTPTDELAAVREAIRSTTRRAIRGPA